VKRGLIALVLTALSLTVLTPASAAENVGSRVVFVGDFETGDFTQWSQCHNRQYRGPCDGHGVEFYGMQVLRKGAHQGRYVARFELRDGDTHPRDTGERAEVAGYGRGLVREGDERWYQFSLRFDRTFPAVTGKYFIVMQWHGADDAKPPMTVSVKGNGQLFLSGNAPQDPQKAIGDIARGRWVDYVVHAKFSRSKSIGWAEVYRDGVLTVPRHARANMNSGFNYLKMGLYRDSRQKATAVMWADRFRVTAP
jgi:hypothetical protein